MAWQNILKFQNVKLSVYIQAFEFWMKTFESKIKALSMK